MRIEERACYVNWKDFNQVIDFNNRYSLELSNYNLLIDNEMISNFIDYKLHYCNLLHKKSEFETMLITLGQVSELVSKLNVNHRNYQYSKTHMNFLLGVVYVNKKKFIKSYIIFSDLVKFDPEKYVDWLYYVRSEIFNLVLNWILVLGAGCLILNLFLPFKDGFYLDLDKFGFIILCAALMIKKFLIGGGRVTNMLPNE
jgi:hypothetical protein